MDAFNESYKKLNKEQKQAVDTTEGPVMVIAGPGTGKTEVLSLRIANIIKNTDTPSNGILALTFTRSGVIAMKNRLEKYIGPESRNVNINTFHGFANNLIEKYYEVLDFIHVPKLIDDKESIFLVDEILNSYEWQYIKTRNSNSYYFNDLKSLISLLKKDQITPNVFLGIINEEIDTLKNDKSNISTRGESKGQLKQDIVKKIESFNKTIEAVKFYQIYEDLKFEKSLMDYDDVLDYAVQIVINSENARQELREEHLYVLVDEHQDSSLVQNNFLKAVWQQVELPNIFVVGDDRQLIYGFSGANINYFEEFMHIFGKAQLITLYENYRSSSNILNLADELLQSNLTKDKLKSNNNINNKIKLNEYTFPNDEIIGTALEIKDLIKSGEKIEDFAILVPKNKHINEIQKVFSGMELDINSEKTVSFFSLDSTSDLINILKIINEPFNGIYLSNSLTSSVSNIDVFTAHKFLKSFKNLENLEIDNLINNKETNNLFVENNPVYNWGSQLKNYIQDLSNKRISEIVSIIGNELLIDNSLGQLDLIKNIEIVRTFMYMASSFEENNPKSKLSDFLNYLNRLDEYNSHIQIALLTGGSGVNVMTLHRSKGLEYKHVYILHMNQEVILGSKRNGFTLPEKIKDLTEKKDEQTIKRELYVAITRAKEHCTISYAKQKIDGNDMSLAYVINDLNNEHFISKNNEENQDLIIKKDIRSFAIKSKNEQIDTSLESIIEFTKEKFKESRISVSLLNNYFSCSWKWYFRNFLKLPEEKGTSLALGSCVHSVLEFILKEKLLPTDDVLQNKVEYFLIQNGISDKIELSKLNKDGFNAVKNYIKYYYGELANDRILERSVSYKDPIFPDLNMYGKLDLVEKFPNGDFVVSDFKTGKSKTKNEIEKLDQENRLSSLMRQLAMYSYLIYGADKGRIVNESRLIFVESESKDKNKIYSKKITQEEVDMLIKDIKDYQDEIISGSWVNRPCYENTYFQEGGKCTYCAKAEKIFKIIK